MCNEIFHYSYHSDNSPATFETPEPRQNQKSPSSHGEIQAEKDDVAEQTGEEYFPLS